MREPGADYQRRKYGQQEKKNVQPQSPAWRLDDEYFRGFALGLLVDCCVSAVKGFGLN
jgi:hypothetical protein